MLWKQKHVTNCRSGCPDHEHKRKHAFQNLWDDEIQLSEESTVHQITTLQTRYLYQMLAIT